MLFVCEQYGQWRAVTSRCYPVERVVLGGDAGRDDGDVPVSAEQHELRARVGERDVLLLVPYGEGRVQHGVGGAALGTRGDDGVRRRDEGERRIYGQPVPRGGAECGDVGGDGQHGDGAGFACVWGEATGECWCGATTIDEVEYPVSAAGTVFHLQCPAGFTGSFERRCNGNGEWEEIENNCVRITCPEESFEGVMWRATEGGLTAVHSCGVV